MRLPRLSVSTVVLSQVLFWTAVAAVPLAAFLAFSIQPLVGKLLLPTQGGAASTWLGAMLYFQITLLLGYGWAMWLLGCRPFVQVASMTGLSLAAIICSQLSWIQQSTSTGLGGVLCALALSTLPAMILLFSIGPLMHGWLRRGGKAVPYHLYAFSNAGSLAAVILYPFTIERAVGLSDQMFFWYGLLWVLAGLVSAAGMCFLHSDVAAPATDEVAESLSVQRHVAWIGLSALTCAGMLGATHHISAEIGSSPIAWVGPFGVYLLSFLVTFSGWWQPRFTLACLGWLAVSLAGFMLSKGVTNVTVNGSTAMWLMSLTAAGSFFGNGLLYEFRPAQRFARFYLLLAAGGVLGGLFASIGAPWFFLRPSEFLALACLLLAIGLLRLLARRDVLTVSVVLLIVMAPVLGLVWKQTHNESAGALSIRRFRNVYGYMMLKFEEGGLILSNETTTHGTQIVRTPESRRRPTLYYTESTGVGRAIEETQKKQPEINLGVVGLGAGTLAAYARSSDRVDFWDINPQAIRIARDFFTFVPDARGQIHIEQADGRQGLQASTIDYDLIVIDAFSGDAIPAHLLTREALAIYFQRLQKRHGLLAIHASSRYGTIFPIVGATARTLGWSTLFVATDITKPAEARDFDGLSTQYLLICRPDQLKEVVNWLPTEEDGGRVKRTLTPYDPPPSGFATVWTDDHHAALDALDWIRFLSN